MGGSRGPRALAIFLVLGALEGCGAREPSEGEPRPEPGRRRDPVAGTIELRLDAFDLAPGTELRRELGAGEVHVLSFELAAGEVLHLGVEQMGVDVVVVASGPLRPPLTFDSPSGPEGVEEVFLVAVASGEHRIEIKAWDASRAGRYRIRVESRRDATLGDEVWAAAVESFYTGRYGTGGYDQRAQDLREAARLAAASGEDAFRARALYELGKLHLRHRRFGLAAASLEQALTTFGDLDDVEKQALAHAQLGAAWQELGETRCSALAHEAALELWRRLERRREEATALSDLGLVARRAGRYRQAFERYRQALEVWQALDEPCPAATTRANLGTSYELFGEAPRAWDNYRQALLLLESCGDAGNQLRPVILTGMGDLLADQGRDEAALVKYREAIELRRGAGDLRGEAVTLNSIALVLARRQPRAAFEAFHSALEILRGLDAASQATVLRNLAELQESAGDLAEARASNLEALKLASEGDRPETGALARLGLARLARREGDLAEALRQATAAIEVVEAERGNIGRGDLRSSYLAERQTYYDFLASVLIELHRTEPSRGHDGRAFEVVERARARGLLDALTKKPSGLGSSARREALRTEINQAHREWLRANRSPAGGDRRRIEVDLRSLLGAFHGLHDGVDGSGAGGGTVPSLEEVRSEMLDAGSLLLAYHLTAEASWVWAVTPEGTELHQVPALRGEIEAAATSLLDSDLRTAEGPRRHLETLSRMLLGPVAEQLADRRLLVVAPGFLQRLPWAALPEPGSARPLGIGHDVVQLPSVAVARALRARAAERAGRRALPELAIVAVADPVFGPGDPRLEPAAARAAPGEPPWLDPLPATEEEARAALDSLSAPGHSYVGFEARRDLFHGDRLADARILHLATHALLDVPNTGVRSAGASRVDPRPVVEAADLAAVVFSRLDGAGRPVDGYLRAYEIRGLDLAADLVVLSACRTVLGEDVRGEGLVGLTQAFLAAGASQVVASLWDVDDRATAELMTRFYQGLNAGLETSRALREAQAAMWRQERWRGPYFWAGFALLGDWRTVAVVRRTPP